MGCFQLSERKDLLKKNSKLKVVPKKIRPVRSGPFREIVEALNHAHAGLRGWLAEIASILTS